MDCPRCGTTSRSGELICSNCGYVNNPTVTTALRTDPTKLRVKRQTQSMSAATNTGVVVLRIRGLNEQIAFDAVDNLILGRTDLEKGFHPGVDLSAYGAAERGVSRAHAILHYEDNHLMVCDLNSANGTLLNGQRLIPNQPYNVNDGDELILGRLPINVNYYAEQS